MVCPNCKENIRNDAVFCPECGTQIQKHSAQDSTKTTSQAQAQTQPAGPAYSSTPQTPPDASIPAIKPRPFFQAAPVTPNPIQETVKQSNLPSAGNRKKKPDLKTLFAIIASFVVVLIAAILIINPFSKHSVSGSPSEELAKSTKYSTITTEAWMLEQPEPGNSYDVPEVTESVYEVLDPVLMEQDLIGIWECNRNGKTEYIEFVANGEFKIYSSEEKRLGDSGASAEITLIDALGSWYVSGSSLHMNCTDYTYADYTYTPVFDGSSLLLDGSYSTEYFPCSYMPSPTDYVIFQSDCSWNQARAYCRELGGHLVTITSEEEERYLVDMAQAANAKYLWIGGTVDPYSGDVIWITGENSHYTDFGPHQPSYYDNDGYTPECELVLWFVSKYVGNDNNTVTGWGWNDVNVQSVVDFYSGRGTIHVLCEFNDGLADLGG